jgi:DNA modification methylase
MATCRIIEGDALAVLQTLPSESIHCCVTSPPYWGLRDYGHDGQIGLEATPEEYVARMVEVFREVRRVLRDDGTCWVNLGDSYAATTKGSGDTGKSTLVGTPNDENGQIFTPRRLDIGSLKPKDLVGIPWRVAFALQADGWWLRQDIIWHKPNPMPESVRDRCTKAHEYVFLLTKSERYFYDAEAVSEASVSQPQPRRRSNGVSAEDQGKRIGAGNVTANCGVLDNRNRRSVWTITTKPYTGAHFAVMPPDLVEPCIKAGCPEDGTVLDPFGGSGTVGAVAVKLNRNAMLIELNAEYVKLARERVERSRLPMFDEEF